MSSLFVINMTVQCIIFLCLFLLINRFLTCYGVLCVMISGLSGNGLNFFNRLKDRC